MITDWDDAYANGAYITDADTYPTLWSTLAAEFRANIPTIRREIDWRYGTHQREVLDIFYPETYLDNSPRGLVVFVHGGYWRAFDKSDWSHLAAGCLERGWAVAIPSYPLSPEARISSMTDSITKAIQCAAAKVAGPICLSGHSAGGHLVTRVACLNSSLSKTVQQRIQSVMSISGLHDLRPLMHTTMNTDWRMIHAEATAESPVLLAPLAGIRICCWVGSEERPEFLRQNDLLANIWGGLGADISAHHAAGKHHFNVIEDLQNANSLMVKLMLEN